MKKYILLFFLLFISIASAHQPLVLVEEEDGSPSLAVYKIKVTNGGLTDNGDGTGSFDLTGGAGDGQGYYIIQDEGSALTQRGTVNFIGGAITCADNAGSTRTDCTLTAGSQLTDLSDVNSATATNGRMLIARDSLYFDSVAMSGDMNINKNGVTALQANSVQVVDIDFINTATATQGYVLMADGTDFEGTKISGDINNYMGRLEVVDDSHTHTSASITLGLTGLTDVNTATATTGFILIADGTDYESAQISGDATLKSGGELTITDGALSLTDLSDVNTATATAGYVLVSDGSSWQSLSPGSDNQVLTIDTAIPMKVNWEAAAGGGASQLTDLTDVNTATATTGFILIADGTDFEGAGLFGDVTLKSGGETRITNDAVGTSEIDLTMVPTWEGKHTFANIVMPNEAGPTTNETGEMSLNTSVTNHQPLFQYYDGDESLYVVAMPTGNLTTTDGHVVSYNAANDEFEMVAQSGGGSTELTDLSDVNTATATSGYFLVADGTDYESRIAIGSDIEILEIGAATYDDVQDWINTTQSAGKLTGGGITDNGDGTIAVAAGTGFIKTTDSDTGDSKFFDWSADTSVSLTDNDTNYIYIEYNSGSPQVAAAATSLPSDKNTNIMLGLVYRDGTTLHIISAGMIATNYAKKTFWKDIEINGKFQRVSGMVIGETGTRNFSLTSGSIYAGLTKVSMAAFDSSGADTFTYMYRDGAGGWTEVASQSQIDNTQYDDGDGTLGTLSDGGFWGEDNYGVHWVYEDADAHVFVLYGQGDYTLAEANNAQPPSTIPDLLSDIGGLVGKIIIQKNASSFTSTQSAFDQTFSPTSVSNHNDMANIQGGASDEYYHLTNADYTTLTNINTATATTGNILMSDAEGFNSVTLGGDVTAAWDGTVTISNGAISLTELSDVNTATATNGFILIADGTDFEGAEISGDITLKSGGETEIVSGAIGLVDLSDVNTATATSGRFIVADGSNWGSYDKVTVDYNSGKMTVGSGDSSIEFTGGYTADPCGTLNEGALFYNTTANEFCYCDGTNDLRIKDATTACF